MKTRVNFKALDYTDIEFGTQKPSAEDQKAFSDFLTERRKSKAKPTQQLTMRVWYGLYSEPVDFDFMVESKDNTPMCWVLAKVRTFII